MADLVIDSNEPVGVDKNPVFYNHDIFKGIPMVKEIFESVKSNFRLAKTIQLPNRYNALIYERQSF